MGVELVKAVAGNPTTARLSGNAYKVLVSMALHALDKPKDGRPGGLYWAGWTPLQAALGYDPEEPGTAGHTAVKRAVRELRDGGHITAMVKAMAGTRQSYLIHPGGIGKGVTTDPQSGKERGSPSDPRRGSPSDPHRGSDSDPSGGRPATLLGRTQEGGGLTEDEITNPASPTTGGATRPVDNKAIDKGGKGKRPKRHPHVGDHDEPCQSCGLTKLNLIHSGIHRRSA